MFRSKPYRDVLAGGPENSSHSLAPPDLTSTSKRTTTTSKSETPRLPPPPPQACQAPDAPPPRQSPSHPQQAESAPKYTVEWRRDCTARTTRALPPAPPSGFATHVRHTARLECRIP